MRKFEFGDFADDYGFMVNAIRYSAAEALRIAKRELGLNGLPDNEFEVTQDYIRYTINGGWEMEHRPCYIACYKDDRGAFPCWRIRHVGAQGAALC